MQPNQPVHSTDQYAILAHKNLINPPFRLFKTIRSASMVTWCLFTNKGTWCDLHVRHTKGVYAVLLNSIKACRISKHNIFFPWLSITQGTLWILVSPNTHNNGVHSARKNLTHMFIIMYTSAVAMLPHICGWVKASSTYRHMQMSTIMQGQGQVILLPRSACIQTAMSVICNARFSSYNFSVGQYLFTKFASTCSRPGLNI